MKNLGERGFVSVLVTIVLVALVAVAGIAVYNLTRARGVYSAKVAGSPSPTLSASPSRSLAATPIATPECANKYTDANGIFSLCPPIGWQATTQRIDGGAWSLAPAEQFFSELAPEGQAPVVTILPYVASPDLQAFEQGEEGTYASINGISITNMTINGQQAFLETQDNSSGYKSLQYFIGKDSSIISVGMALNPTSETDNTRYVDEFTQIAQSLKILK